MGLKHNLLLFAFNDDFNYLMFYLCSDYIFFDEYGWFAMLSYLPKKKKKIIIM